mmetsp:Transcript_33272/g.77774  ORF Transcript_33272/g.77774 Transcript_33272/m.77774 type:complete len:274 (-) Transcript_33272:528-1349(-)
MPSSETRARDASPWHAARWDAGPPALHHTRRPGHVGWPRRGLLRHAAAVRLRQRLLPARVQDDERSRRHCRLLLDRGLLANSRDPPHGHPLRARRRRVGYRRHRELDERVELDADLVRYHRAGGGGRWRGGGGALQQAREVHQLRPILKGGRSKCSGTRDQALGPSAELWLFTAAGRHDCGAPSRGVLPRAMAGPLPSAAARAVCHLGDRAAHQLARLRHRRPGEAGATALQHPSARVQEFRRLAASEAGGQHHESEAGGDRDFEHGSKRREA